MTTEGQKEQAVDQEARQRFAKKASTDVIGFMNVCICILGDRLGLFKDLAVNGPATSLELAARTGTFERYVEEWLKQMTCAGYVRYDPTNERFSLPPEHAPVLAEEGGPHFLGGLYQNVQSIEQGLFTKLLQAFRAGAGVPYEAYNDDYWDGLDRFTGPRLIPRLVKQYIPAMPDVQRALERGALVADLGCGRGGIITTLAQVFPASRFVGYDAFAPNIARAQVNARAAGVGDRVRFVPQDAGKGLPEKYDLILSFDTLHHATDVLHLLRTIRQALNPGGTFVCAEARCAETLEANIGPGGAMMYASSVLVCVPQVLSESDVAFGTAGVTESKMRELSAQAGFGNLRLVPIENAVENLYEIRV